MAWGIEAEAADTIAKALAERGADTAAVEAHLADPGAPERVFDEVESRLGGVTALVMCHCGSVDSGLWLRAQKPACTVTINRLAAAMKNIVPQSRHGTFSRSRNSVTIVAVREKPGKNRAATPDAMLAASGNPNHSGTVQSLPRPPLHQGAVAITLTTSTS